jgi:hypothetical protein
MVCQAPKDHTAAPVSTQSRRESSIRSTITSLVLYGVLQRSTRIFSKATGIEYGQPRSRAFTKPCLQGITLNSVLGSDWPSYLHRDRPAKIVQIIETTPMLPATHHEQLQSTARERVRRPNFHKDLWANNPTASVSPFLLLNLTLRAGIACGKAIENS